MINESYPWKQDLKTKNDILIKYNKPEYFEKDKDKTFTKIEKSIFYSAFIIRKLLDCRTKLSGEADNYLINAKSIKSLTSFDILNRWIDENSYDWEYARRVRVKGRNLCNWLIHSFIFFLDYDEENKVSGFCVSSDYDKNSCLYQININDWIRYVKFIYTDYVVDLEFTYNEDKKENEVVKKNRENIDNYI